MSQQGNLFGTANKPQIFVFGTGAQNSSTTNLFGNSTANTTGTSPFGTNQSTNVFSGTNVKSNPSSGQGLFNVKPASKNIFGTNNNNTTTRNPGAIGNPTLSQTSGDPFIPKAPTVVQTGPALFTTGTNIFGSPTAPISNPFNFGSSATKKDIFGSSTTFPPNPVVSGVVTAQPVPNAASNTNQPILFKPGFQPATNNSLFPQAMSTSTFPNAASNASGSTFQFKFTPVTNTPTVQGWNPPVSGPSTSNTIPNSAHSTTSSMPTINNWSPQPSTSTGTATPAANIWSPQPPTSTGTANPAANIWPSQASCSIGTTGLIGHSWSPQSSTSTAVTNPLINNHFIQPNTSTTMPFLSSSPSTILPNTNEPSKVTTTSIFHPQTTIGLTTTGNQPTLIPSSSTGSIQTPKSEQITSINQQNFLAASLLDPYANCGRKNYSTDNSIQSSAVSTVVSTSPISTTAPTVVPVHIQSNHRKVSCSRSPIDINLKLKPVSSLPTLNDNDDDDDVPSTNQRSVPSVTSAKSTLAGSFTDEEELVLLGQSKMSKLRLSNHVPNISSESNVLRSLYPIRRLAELERLSNITPRSLSPTIPTTVHQQPISRSSNQIRDISPIRPSSAPIVTNESSSPIIQRKSSNNNNQIHQLPILTRDFYYMKPSRSELKSLFNDQGQCILKQFTVGHEKYGSVTFYGQINIAGLNLDEIIEINRHEVIVYPDDDHKPAVGEQLNLPARITLFDIYPTDRTTREQIKDIERIKAINYRDHLRELTKKFDGEFIDYEINDGSWTFMVKHFTRYGLDDNQNDVCSQS